MSSDLSRRGFSGWVYGNISSEYGGTGVGTSVRLWSLPPEFLLKSVLKRCEPFAGALWQWHLLGRSCVAVKSEYCGFAWRRVL